MNKRRLSDYLKGIGTNSSEHCQRDKRVIGFSLMRQIHFNITQRLFLRTTNAKLINLNSLILRNKIVNNGANNMKSLKRKNRVSSGKSNLT